MAKRKYWSTDYDMAGVRPFDFVANQNRFAGPARPGGRRDKRKAQSLDSPEWPFY